MNKLSFAALLGLMFLPSAFSKPVPLVLHVAPTDAQVTWEGRKKIGSKHTGTVLLKSGTVLIEKGKLVGGEIAIDMTSLKDTDIQSEGMNAKLVGHLKSPDFFDVSHHPVATFTITKVEPAAEGMQKITGNLAIKGQSLATSFEAKVAHKGKQTKLSGAIPVDRTKYGIRYGSASFFADLGDKVIEDVFTVAFDLTAKAGK